MIIESRTWDELAVGDTAELRRLCTVDDLFVFAAASGNHNPMHLPGEDGDGDGVADGIVPGMFVASLISAVLGNVLPGPGTLYLAQTLMFHNPAFAGEELLSRVTVTEKRDGGEVILRTEVQRPADGSMIVSGEARVVAPKRKLRFDDLKVPGLVVQRHRHFEALLERAKPLPALITAVVCPEEANSLGGALLAAEQSIITPILIGSRAKIAATALALGKDLAGYEILDAPTHPEAARLAVDLVNAGRAQAIMKGHLHTEELLHPMLDKVTGLRVRVAACLL